MRRTLAVSLLLVVVALAVPAGAASKNFARLERVEVEPYFGGLARVTAYLNVYHLEGTEIEKIKPDDLQLVVGGSKRKETPGIIPYEYVDDDLEIVVVLETQGSFQTAVELLRDPFPKFIQGLPKGAKVALVTYGHQLKPGPLEETAKAAKRFGKISADDEDNDQFRLLDSVNKAIKIFKDAKPSSRKIILVISDGLDKGIDPTEADDKKGKALFVKAAKDASEAGITIDTIAFSMTDNRPPFLNLAELSRKTAGMFRWVRDRSGFAPALEAVKTELRREMVATWFLPPDAIGNKNVKVVCKSPLCAEPDQPPLESNEKKAPAPRCDGNSCSADAACIQDQCLTLAMTGRHMGWGFWLGVPAALLAGGALVVARKRKKQGGATSSVPVAGQPMQPGQPAAPNPQAQQAAIAAQMQAQAAQQMYAMARGARFQVLSGPLAGQMIPIKHGMTIGKDPASDLVINDGYASTRHAQVVCDPNTGSCMLFDLGSTNGTFINGQRLMAPQPMTNGTSVRIGQTDMRFVQ